MDADIRSSLIGIRMHWEKWYEVSVTDDATAWTAVPIGDPDGALTTDNAASLRVAIQNDCADRKAKRERARMDSLADVNLGSASA